MDAMKPFHPNYDFNKINDQNKWTIPNSIEIVKKNVSCMSEKMNRFNKMDHCSRMCNANSEYDPDTPCSSIQLATHGPQKNEFRDKSHPIYSVSIRQPNCRRNRTNYSNEINIVMKGISWIALLDTGSCRSSVSKEFVYKCKIDITKLQDNNVKFLMVANGQALKIKG